MIRRAIPLALILPAATLAAGQARAHAFQAGAESYAAFVEGAYVPLNDPMILMPLLATGLAIGIWRREGMLTLWPALLAGLVAGLFLAPLVGPGFRLAGMILAVPMAVLGVAARAWPAALMQGLVALVGLTSGLIALEGHGWGSLPWMISAGVLFGANMVAVVPAGMVAASRDRITNSWLMIGWRVAASWVGATAVLVGTLVLAL